MDDLDRKIEEALSEEDRSLMNEFGEQGMFALLFSVYRGPQAWIVSLTTLVMLIMIIGAFYSLWKLIEVGGGPEAIKWGAAALILMTMVSFIKVWFWIRMEANRVIREVKRLELQIARLQANTGG
ncbi:MAG: hypothetical protein JKX88_05405 [Marinicaulis sp.]|nr:hypothetical protein [Marinicaulis sp.]